MKITILGSGTCVPSLERHPCSVLVSRRRLNILLDIGPGIMGQLLRAGVDPDDIDAVFLSHFHLDHCAELAPFLFAAKYPEFTRKKKLTLVGGPGLSDWLARVSQAFGHTIDMPKDDFECLELSGTGSVDLSGIQVSHMPMDHKPESLGYRFTDERGFSMVYSGDTDTTDNLVLLAGNADILVCESAMPDGMKVPGHLTPSLAGDAARRAGVKTLVLTHLYPVCDTVDVAAQAQKHFDGKVIAAEDLMEIVRPPVD